jgi:anti-anti-sigma factor
MAERDGPERERVPRVEIVVVEAFDVTSVPRLTVLLNEAMAVNPAELVVDLAACPTVDAAAIALLVEVHRQLRRTGGLLTLRSPSARLRRNLHLARVDGVLHVTPEPPL